MAAGISHGRAIYVVIIADAARLLADGAGTEEGGVANARAEKFVRPRSGAVWAAAAVRTERQASNKITLDACAGDFVRIYAKSGSSNFEDAVVIGDTSPAADLDRLQAPTPVQFKRSDVAPHDRMNVLPARFSERDFWFWQCTVTTSGDLHCDVLLAVHDRDEHGRPRFAGHYRWGLQLSVNLTSPSPAAVAT